MVLPLVDRIGADHREGAGLHHQREPSHGGVGSVADHAPDRAEQGSQEQQLGRDPQFRGLAGDQGKAERATARIADRAGFCAVAAARATEGLRRGPPFAPAAL
jgi:hypothetical protein